MEYTHPGPKLRSRILERALQMVVVNGAVVESVEEFVYLGSLQSTDIGPAVDIMRHIGITAGSMRNLDNI